MYYILHRAEEKREVFQVVGPIPEGQDPLYGYGSYNLLDGPYNTLENADRVCGAFISFTIDLRDRLLTEKS
jgi:hypothetical protein